MNKKPVLVVMAAGMGSRYGGLKQIDPMGPHGELMIDYAIYDAKCAGFETVIFIIKREIEEAFKVAIGDRVSKVLNVKYAYQELTDLPKGYSVPKERIKPWGTAHAILAARDLIDGPFAVMNADDYYGPTAFKLIYDFLIQNQASIAKASFAMVGYALSHTVTENGHVARGICEEDQQGYLVSVTERTWIEKVGEHARYSEDNGLSWHELSGDSTVSMNLWGLTQKFIDEAWQRLPKFLDETLKNDPAKGEYFLPSVVSALISEQKAAVKVLHSTDKWYGVTYQADKPQVKAALAQKIAEGCYPEKLF